MRLVLSLELVFSIEPIVLLSLTGNHCGGFDFALIQQEFFRSSITLLSFMGEISIFGQLTTMTEIMGIVTGITGVWLTMKRSILCFPVGIVNVIIYAYLFFSDGIRLYADGLLQCIYVGLLIFGWINWGKMDETKPVVERINFASLRKCILISLAGFIVLGYFFKNYTNASLPWLDSALTIASLAAQWMIAKKFIENWWVWIVADLIYIPLYYYKSLPLTALLYAVFLVLAVMGLLSWQKQLKTAQK